MMAEIDLTSLNRAYRQGEQDRQNSFNINGTPLDDRIELYNGNIFGGAGNDYVARLDPDNGSVSINFWNAERGVRIHLAEGWAEDGMGGLDTLVNIISATGSQNDDYFWGDRYNNYFYGQAGHDVINGGAGIDSIGVAGITDTNGHFRETLLSELLIDVSADGRTAVVQDPTGTGQYFRYDLYDVEFVYGLTENNEYALLELSGLIQPSTVALTTVAAGPDYRWNLHQPLGTAASLTYSFMAETHLGAGKRALSQSEQTVVRNAMALVSSFTGLSFTEVEESAQNVGQIRWGVSQQSNSKGLTWLPQLANLTGQAGDILMDEESMLYLQEGGQGLEAILHELGHALGLRHPVNSASNDQWAQVAAERFNTAQLTVMAQPKIAEDLARADFGLLDIAALRYLYGAKEVNTASSIYKLVDSDGQSLKTIVDDGGHDIVDCSALSSGVRVNLVDGTTWDIGLTKDGVQATNNMATAIGSFLESVVGTAFDDVLIGNAHNNQFTPGKGNDWIEGGEGLDTIYLPEQKTNYVLGDSENALELWSVNTVTGLKYLTDIERLVFSDSAVAWDLDGNAGLVAKILGAVFGPDAVKNTLYAGIGLDLMDGGFSYSQLMGLAIDTKLGIGASHAQVIDMLYKNLTKTPADSTAIAYWSGLLDQGLFSHESLAIMAAELDLNKQNINLTGLVDTGLEYMPV